MALWLESPLESEPPPQPAATRATAARTPAMKSPAVAAERISRSIPAATRAGGDESRLRVVRAHLGRTAAGEAGTRARARLGALAGSALLLDRGSLGRLRLLLVGEDLVLGLALQQRDELLRLDRLALEQDPRDRVELLAVLGEDVLGGLVGVLDHPADLIIDLAGDLVRVVRLGGELTAEEGHGTVVAEDART